MSCYRPLKMFYTYPCFDKNGKETFQTKIVSHDTHHLEEHYGQLWPIKEEQATPGATRVFYRSFDIPCGRCIGCRLDYSRTWANRLMAELAYHDAGVCWFVTLTYDNENVPTSHYVDDKTGEVLESLTLRKRDVQLFHKALRRSYPDWRIRYYLAGEYGENTKRPHYHAIYFDLPLDFTAMDIWSRTSQGFTVYECKELEKIWNRGRVVVSSVSWETCAYTSRYVTKKLNGPEAEFYKIFNLEPEFSLMSRKPGIGRQWYDEHGLQHEIILKTEKGKRTFMPPRYYKELDKEFHPEEAEINAYYGQERLKNKVESIKNINGLADQDYLCYLEEAEAQKIKSIAVLKRSVI